MRLTNFGYVPQGKKKKKVLEFKYIATTVYLSQ